MMAVFSPCQQYRYILKRDLALSMLDWHKPCLFILLNPSTATAVIDDQTVRKCISFANRERCSELTIVNLYAYRATDPDNLHCTREPVGPENDKHLTEQIERHRDGLIICGWGAFTVAQPEGEKLLTKLNSMGVRAQCLGRTKKGFPKHPLYLSSKTPLEVYP